MQCVYLLLSLGLQNRLSIDDIFKACWKKYIIDIPSQQLGAAVAHFLNCYHGTLERQKTASGENSPPSSTQNKKKKNKKGKGKKLSI